MDWLYFKRTKQMSKDSALKRAPKPFFDTLEHMENPGSRRVSEDGVERVLGGCSEQAMEDYQMADEFIYTYRGSQETFRQYRKTLEQLLAWTWLVNGKSLRETQRQDIEKFIEFCVNPPRAWIGRTRQVRFRDVRGKRVPNRKWRPYCSRKGQYAVSAGTLRTCFNTLGSFFNFLVEEAYILQNPVKRMRQKSKFIMTEQEAPPPRVLSTEQWHYVLDAAEELADFEPKNHERTLFVLSAMFCMYLRISEFVESDRWRPNMGHFFRDAHGRWWFKTVGKGNKERTVSVCGDMLEALKRYRRYRGLTGLPLPGENSVLVHGRSKSGTLTTTRIRQLCKQVFMHAAWNMRAEGKIEDAEVLEVTTPHWLRHTGISFDVPHRPLHHIRDDAGHSSIRTTNRYIGAGLAERHGSAQYKSVRLALK